MPKSFDTVNLSIEGETVGIWTQVAQPPFLNGRCGSRGYSCSA